MLDRDQRQVREHRYNIILNHAPAMIAYLDGDARFQFVNQKYCELHGTSAEEIVGRTLDELLGTDLVESIRERLDAVLRGEQQRFETKIRNQHGEERWVEATYVPDSSDNGKARGFFAFIQDIHDRKVIEQSRARFEYAVDQGVEGFALHDEEGNFSYVNPSQAAMYGYDPAEILGKSWALFYDEDQFAEIEAVHHPKLMRDGKWQGELVGRKKNGEKFDVEVSLTLLADEFGNPSGMVCNCQDITQRKISEEAFRQLQKMDAVGQLTGGVAHDFNNLLAVIVGNLDLLSEQTESLPDLNDLVQRALGAAERGANLTQRLLAFSRKQSLQPRALDLNELVYGMDDLIRRSLGERIEIMVYPETSIWACEADPSQLENAILNLALNARDAMQSGGILEIRTKNIAAKQGGGKAGGDQVRLSISDSGTGMSDEVRERIFDPFFTTKDVGKGSGLGLSMVHGFVSQSGGRIKVSSTEGEGTAVKIFLPRSYSEMVEPDRRTGKSQPAQGRAEMVLVVEDDPDVRRMAVSMLHSLGYRTAEAGNGQEALQRLASLPNLDLLISDVVLPSGFGGPELAEHARRSHPGIKILFMSGYTASADDLDASEVLIAKPFTKAALAEKLREARDGSSVGTG